MGRYTLLQVTCLALATLLAVTVTPQVKAAPTEICSAPGDQAYPQISGRYIVWQEDSSGSRGIYMYDLEEQQESPVSVSGGFMWNPAIHGDRIVWFEQNWDNFPGITIQLYNITTATQTSLPANLTGGISDLAWLGIWGDVVTWSGNGLDSDVFYYDIGTGTTMQLTHSGLAHRPDAWGNRIVWYEYRNYQRHDIFMYDISTETETQITDDSELQTTPSIWGDRIVWVDYRNANGYDESGNSDVYMFNIVTGEETRLTGGNYHYDYPIISGNKVVWNANNGIAAELQVYDIPSGRESTVVEKGILNYFEFFDFDGDNVVYDMQSEETGNDVYLITLPDNTSFWIVCGATALIVACVISYFIYRMVKKKPGQSQNGGPPLYK